MANAFTGGQSGAAWDLLVETAYDRAVDFFLNDIPFFRDVATKRPVAQAMPGETVTFTIHNKIPVTTTALPETTDPDAVAAPAPTRISVTLHEQGTSTIRTLYVDRLAFTQPSQEIVELVGRNQADTIDQLVLNEMLNGTNVLRMSGGALSSSAAQNTIASTDVMTAKMVVAAVAKMRGRKAQPIRGESYVAYLHPDVTADVMTETGVNGWVATTQYTDRTPIMRGETGSLRGAAVIESPRCPIVSGGGVGGTVNVYQGFLVGNQALAEAVAIEPHTVVGPVVDKFKRFYPLSWHTLIGWKMYRQEALTRLEVASSIAGLS